MDQIPTTLAFTQANLNKGIRTLKKYLTTTLEALLSIYCRIPIPPYLSYCGLDYFITILEILQVSI